MTWNKTIPMTQHTCNNGGRPVFGRLTAGCPRCDELKAGAPTRKGWGASGQFQYKSLNDCRGPVHARTLNPGGYCTTCGAGSDYS